MKSIYITDVSTNARWGAADRRHRSRIGVLEIYWRQFGRTQTSIQSGISGAAYLVGTLLVLLLRRTFNYQFFKIQGTNIDQLETLSPGFSMSKWIFFSQTFQNSWQRCFIFTISVRRHRHSRWEDHHKLNHQQGGLLEAYGETHWFPVSVFLFIMCTLYIYIYIYIYVM